MAASVGIVGLARRCARSRPCRLPAPASRPSLRSVLRHWPSACVWRQRPLDGQQRGARQRHQLVAHAQEVLADDVQAGIRQQVVDVGDAPRHRVLDRDHGVARIARSSPPPAHPRRWRRPRLQVGKHLAAGQVRVGARLALVGRRARSARLRSRRGRALGLGRSRRRFRFSVGHGAAMAMAGGCEALRQPGQQSGGRARDRREYRPERNGVNDASRRCACRPPARAAARAARASRAARAAATRSARARERR